MEEKKTEYLVLNRRTCAGGFPPDYVFWGNRTDISDLKFSGEWRKERGSDDYACISEAFYQPWDWKKTTVMPYISKKYKNPKTIHTSPEGVKYKILGFSNTNGYTIKERVYSMRKEANEYVTHNRDSYELVIEVVEDPR